ncbi:hypothetical protein [Pendulispora albinea]|uniref:Uncharacterized protein n=1 Tax=Pendulispora albinea TaxID=2741071 RepID=A0ABZ2M9R0_9BACT
MYISRAEWEQGLAVWWSWGVVSDEDWEHAFNDMRALVVHAVRLPFRCAVLLYLDTDRPDAVRRKQLAELADHPNYNPYIACVTRDPHLRGAQVAMRWVGRHPTYEKNLFDTVDQGIAWLEEKRGTALPALRLMATNVRRIAKQMDAASAGKT